MNSKDIILISGIAALIAYLYSQSAQASTDNGASVFDSPGSWIDTITSAFAGDQSALPNDATEYDSGADRSFAPTAGEASSGIFDRITGILNMGEKWKVGEYPAYAQAIAQAEIANDIPPDLLARLLYQESHYRADIISGATRSAVGAVGIAQFMPATAAQYGVNPLDPWQSIDGAARMLRELRNSKGNWPDALASYNWGAGNVAKWKAGTKTMPTETVNYVAQITADVPVT